MRSLPVALIASMLWATQAFAVPVAQDPPISQEEEGNIVALVNEYLQAAAGASGSGDWLDAAPAGDAINRGQSLIIPQSIFLPGTVFPEPGEATIDGLNNTSVSALISANNGTSSISSEALYLSQFNVTYTSELGSSTTFEAFCIDLFHTVSSGQTYAVDAQNDLSTAYANGAEMMYIMENYGETDLSGDPEQAAAVQIALWDLSLNNQPTPTSFTEDVDGTYSSGDEAVFSVQFKVLPEPSSAALLITGLSSFGAVRLRRRLRRRSLAARVPLSLS
jgi:hypothetical protein